MGKRQAGEIRGFVSVGHYIQGPGAIRELPEVVKKLGKTAFFLVDPFFYADMVPKLQAMFSNTDVDLHFLKFEGECSRKNIQKLLQCLEQLPAPAEVLVGFGGGKTMDTIRAASKELRAALIQVPTSASSDAAASCIAVVYEENHSAHAVFLEKDPDYVIADTELIVQAPARMLAAGIGDALSTYYEARSCWLTNNVNYVGRGYRMTRCSLAIAQACRDLLLECGEAAYRAACRTLRTQEFEDVVEAIQLLSGLGWENCGTAIAHALVEGLDFIPEAHRFLHGELVAFGTLVQMVMDRDPREEFDQVYRLCKTVGLPVCLADFGIIENVEEKARYIVEMAFQSDDGMRITNYESNADMAYQALMYLDSLAQHQSV